MKKTLLILIPVCAVILLISAKLGYNYWYNLPENKMQRAFGAEDYKAVVELYGQLSKDEDKSEVKERLINIAVANYEDYLVERIEYKEAKDFFDCLLQLNFGRDTRVSDYRKMLKEVKESRDVFMTALQKMEEKKFIEAIASFEKVSVLDEVYYNKAKEHTETCKVGVRDLALAEAEHCMESEEYEKAQTVIFEALDILPEDGTLLEMQKEIQKYLEVSIKGNWSVKYDLGELIAQEMGLQGEKLYFPAMLVLECTDREVKMYVRKESIRMALDAMLADEKTMDLIYEVAADYGIKKGEADLLVKLMYGGSYTRFILDRFETQIDQALERCTYESVYHLDPYKLYVGTEGKNENHYYFYKQEGTKLILEGYVGEESVLKMLNYPMTLEREN